MLMSTEAGMAVDAPAGMQGGMGLGTAALLSVEEGDKGEEEEEGELEILAAVSAMTGGPQ